MEVCEGELINLQGKILSVDGNKITIMPKHEDLKVSKSAQGEQSAQGIVSWQLLYSKVKCVISVPFASQVAKLCIAKVHIY